MAKKSKARNAAEIIILMQSVFLMSFGICGYTASNTIVSAFKALTNFKTAAYIITDNAIVTDTGGKISTAEAEAIVKNFEFVCVSCLFIGSVIFIANTIRFYKTR